MSANANKNMKNMKENVANIKKNVANIKKNVANIKNVVNVKKNTIYVNKNVFKWCQSYYNILLLISFVFRKVLYFSLLVHIILYYIFKKLQIESDESNKSNKSDKTHHDTNNMTI